MRLTETGLTDSDPYSLTNCTLCPRNCNANRHTNRRGYCNAGAGTGVVSVCIHKGEEPPVSGTTGICNVFFYRCNLQCIYCQNCQISARNRKIGSDGIVMEDLIPEICNQLDSGCRALGFVSPSHMVPQMLAIIDAVRATGRNPVIVYNTNAYEKVSVLRNLEGIIDVYIPDFKYSDPELAGGLSDARDYPVVAEKAIGEMFRQKGSPLITDEDGQALSGLIIRHLVIPGQVENSLKVLRFISRELSPKVHVSLMSQYHPMPAVEGHPFLGRFLTADEYFTVTREMESLGLDRGWVQSLESSNFYLPDFTYEHPFEKK